MLEGVADLTLRQLNDATQAWVEMEYNRESTLNSARARWPSISRRKTSAVRAGRRRGDALLHGGIGPHPAPSDGTLTVAGVRCEVPSRYGHLERLHLRMASWDLSQVHLVDPKTGVVLCRLYPLDKHRNATGRRATRVAPVAAAPIPPTGLAPLLAQLIAQYAATGLPPAYLAKAEREDGA